MDCLAGGGGDLHGRADPHLGPRPRDRSGREARPGSGRGLFGDVPTRNARTGAGSRNRGPGRRCRPGRFTTGSPAGDHGSATVTGPAVEDAIRALAHPGRRAMLRLVWDDERPATELADAAGLSRSAASQHLKLLREAGLVQVRVDATRRLYRADLARVAEIASFLDDFWATPLERLKATAEAGHRSATPR